MNMHNQISTRLFTRFDAYADLAEQLTDELLHQKVDVPKHKSLAEHLWCVVGARESYATAIETGAWPGFSCSMESFTAKDFKAKLTESSNSVRSAVSGLDAWSDEQSEFLATLAEHEVMHEGQIIRHMYALERELPASWVWA